MSKVVHLSGSAHEQAKAYCVQRGLSMSDWVAALIAQATAGIASESVIRLVEGAPATSQKAAEKSKGPARTPKRSVRAAAAAGAKSKGHREPKRAIVEAKGAEPGPRARPLAEPPRPPSHWFDEDNDESVHLYTAPPFWDRERRSNPALGGDGPTAH